MIKHVEYTRHSLTEPMLLTYIYKKVEDGKIVSAFRIMLYKDTIISVFEDDSLQGGEISDVIRGNIKCFINLIKKYYDENTDDLVIYGEQRYVDELLEEISNVVS
ncbi:MULTISPECIES: hypothetical protein [Acidianus]|uniref:Uncharacterized protein n=1 Tax=Candidatus Acidianus copahuensis TaxID=1160895 RepID=A0A031LPI6_9CREN|nr:MULTISPECIES: hypothetical protein [Acidianus]EZQ04728.1 hypothetical protein CM19_08410 [Candidatus Acidianus copahuensis]NON63033.1 hypothetical protein [Acidianus sp. RZ1]